MPSESGQRVLVDSSLPEASAVSAAGVLVSSSLSSGPSLGTLREDEQQPVQMLLSLAQPPDGDTMETHSVQNTDHEFLEPQLKTAEEVNWLIDSVYSRWRVPRNKKKEN